MRVILAILCPGVIAASCLASGASNLPSLKAQRWVNSPPLTVAALREKVVLVDFWEYTCVNWIRDCSVHQGLESRLRDRFEVHERLIAVIPHVAHTLLDAVAVATHGLNALGRVY